MLTDDQFANILQQIPMLASAEAAIQREFRETAFLARVAAGRDVFALGDEVNAIALLLSGTIRVYKIGDTGREITLYRFSAGQSCILTANAILNRETFSAIAQVEDDAEAVMIPSDDFRAWVDRYAVWREFVFQLLSQRLASVLEIVDEVAFGRMDARVAALLLERAQQGDPLKITHQEIAAELGSSREVISRILGSMANQKLIALGRGSIAILDAGRLQNLLA